MDNFASIHLDRIRRDQWGNNRFASLRRAWNIVAPVSGESPLPSIFPDGQLGFKEGESCGLGQR
jgi:hypothetical protein